MKTHELKTDPDVFYALISGRKTYEIRRDDRGFRVGDTLVLRRTVHSGDEMAQGEPLRYTGEEAVRRVTHILEGPAYGIAEGWVILSVNDTGRDALAAHVERQSAVIFQTMAAVDERLLPLPALEQKVGFKHTKIHELIRDDEFPPGKLIQGKHLWLEREIDDWIQHQWSSAS